MPQSAEKKRTPKQPVKLELQKVDPSKIVIDDAKGLVFDSEDDLYLHFEPQIQKLETEYTSNREPSDIQDDDLQDYEELLAQVLDDPDEVWEDSTSVKGFVVHNYIGHFNADGDSVFYVAVAYRTQDTPSFVFLHFATNNPTLMNRFRRGEIVFDRVSKEVENGAVDGDALSEGDELAVGLYKAMLTVRSDRDIPEAQFKEHESMRESTIEDADEIWRTNDLSGHVLVSFIKDFSDEDNRDVTYIVVTIEDSGSSSHALLFSFPTRDKSLIERYRHGENLQAEEIVQEASH